jgi:hypothetical protein
MATLSTATPALQRSQATQGMQRTSGTLAKVSAALPSVGASALKTANMVQKNQTGAAPPAATVAGANGAASDLGTYIDPSQTAAGKAATGAAQAAVGTQQQAAKLGEAASQTMFEQNEGAGSHLSGGLGSAAMAAAGQQHLNNINSYNGQLAAWQQGIASAQQNLGSMEAGFGSQAGQNATAALGNVQSAEAAGTPTTLPGSGGTAGHGPNTATTTAQTALNTGATNEVSSLNTFASGSGKWNGQGAAATQARKVSQNIGALQAALGQYAPGSPEYNQIAQAIQDWTNLGNSLMNLGYDSKGGYKGGQENIARDALARAGKDPSKDTLPGGLNIQGF